MDGRTERNVLQYLRIHDGEIALAHAAAYMHDGVARHAAEAILRFGGLDLLLDGAVETAVEDLKKAMADGGLEAITSATDKLTTASHKLAEAMYKTQSAGGPGGTKRSPGKRGIPKWPRRCSR